MIVADLLDLLKDVPLTHKVILQSDSEGNDFSPLEDAFEAGYVPSSAWSGDLDETENDNAIILVPVN